MDYQFPNELFPSFYNRGPPDSAHNHCAGNLGSYESVRLQGRSGPLSSRTFTSKHRVRGELWRHTEPVPVPLMSPKNAVLWPAEPPDPLDFSQHMQNFFMDYHQDAFGCMSDILGENFNFKEGLREKYLSDSVDMWRVREFLDMQKFRICQRSYTSRSMHGYSALLFDVVHSVPPELLGALLHEELTAQRDRQLFCEGATGGALAFVPFSQSGSGSQHGCLLYPGDRGLDRLNFHRVELQHHKGSPSCVDTSSTDPFSFQLKGPVRQISTSSLFNECCVAVRSDYQCGVWKFSETSEPRLLQAVSSEELATCISASPHISGEVLVASESGAVQLWTVGKGLHKLRKEDGNLYFDAKSSWRWCEFSAHPRVIVYADRTGVELSDIRMSPASSHTLFSISRSSECCSGERFILSRYLGDVHAFHHLITTQYSAYIMDERFPTVPMLKWGHMMQAPPMFCHVVPGSQSMAGTSKILLGAHSSQEITMLQYSGGKAEACCSRGPPRALLRPRDSLKHLPVQLPHRLNTATNRLSQPATGLTCIQMKRGNVAGGEECLCILQLTQAGDIFYQILEPDQPEASRPPAAEDEEPSQPPASTTSGRATAKQLQPDSSLVVSETSSDEGVIEPTQAPNVLRLVCETPEREQPELSTDSDSSVDSDSARRRANLKRLKLQVIVNDDTHLDQAHVADTDVQDGKEETNGNAEETRGGSGSLRDTPQVKLSDSSLITLKLWLQKAMKTSQETKSRLFHLQHLTTPTGSFLHPSYDQETDLTEAEHVGRLQRDLRACMSKRSLVVQDSVSLEAAETVPVPNQVDTDEWTDQLSRRLTVSWQGEEAWRAWWDDELGLNKESKVEALKEKRRRQKEARRAAGQRLKLSGSFTSSLSCHSQLSDFHGSGWSSAASQSAWSDSDYAASQQEDFRDRERSRATSPSSVHTEPSARTPSGKTQCVEYEDGDRQTPRTPLSLSQPQTPKANTTPASLGGNKRPAGNYLSSLWASQEQPLQTDSYFPDSGSPEHPPPPPVTSSSSSQLRSSQRSLGSFSQSLPLSQRSQGQVGRLQASKPRKRSQMGF